MIFLGRLFGFVVVMVLISAVFLNVADKFNVEGVVELASTNLVLEKNDEILQTEEDLIFEYVEPREDLPLEFRSGYSNRLIRRIEVNTHNELREAIFDQRKVLVLLDNQYLKNPFIPFDTTFLVTLTGYNRTHFFSDGSEIGGNNFTYVADDLIRVFRQSGSQAWILN